ncbi:MAG TPA: transglycosylase SLT domain-containing protein, partial [bacterium]
MGSIVNWLKKGSVLAVLVLMVISLLNFSTHVTRRDYYEEGALTDIRRSLAEVCGVMISDVARSSAISRVIRIIDTYNENMSAATKYEVANEIYEMSLKYDNLDIDLICATITHESALTWRPTVISPVGARGLMQIMPYVGQVLCREEGLEWTSTEEILYDPVI